MGNKVFIPRIVISPSNTKWPFVLKRRQFPIFVCFAMIINKSQGQSLKHVGLFLPKPIFSHGQLYFAISRVTSRNGLKLLIIGDDGKTSSTTKNIIYKEVFRNIHINMWNFIKQSSSFIAKFLTAFNYYFILFVKQKYHVPSFFKKQTFKFDNKKRSQFYIFPK